MIRILSFILGGFILSSCAMQGQTPVSSGVGAKDKLVLSQVHFQSLPGWQDENFSDFAQAYRRSCDVLLKRESQLSFGAKQKNPELFGRLQDWQIPCRKFQTIAPANAQKIRAFFEENFTPYSVSNGAEKNGLFTGYYEPYLRGSRTRTGVYQTPLRARPDDLVMVNLGDFREDMKGQRIAGRVTNGTLTPYESRADILEGKLPKAQDRALVWVDDPADAFFLQIQGSGIVQMDDGSTLRVGYDGQNGHAYYAVGRALVERGALKKEDVSLQTIRAWMDQNPDQADDLMLTNPSYVFFREVTGDGPIGAQGVALTPLRSLAVDSGLLPYGMPVYLDAELPDGGASGKRFSRLMVTQDTGGAILGAVRGDVFWGHGETAEKLAGAMKSKGQYWILLPNMI